MFNQSTIRALAKHCISEFRIGDFDRLAMLFARWEGKFEQLSCGRFDGTLRVARGRRLQAHLVTANQSLRVQGREQSGTITITLVLPESAGCVWQGKRLDAGYLVVRSGEVEIDHRTSKRAVNLSIMVSEDCLLQASRILTRSDLRPITWLALQPAPAAFARLEARIREFLATSGAYPLSDLQFADWIEEACLTAAAEALFPTPYCRKVDMPIRARTALVRRAEDFMRARLRTPVGESALCALLGVSGRTLRLAFREQFGLGPMAYFQTLRLHAARAELKATDIVEVSVSRIARDFGFYHPGKFAGYYHRQFGELPSETLGDVPPSTASMT